MMNEKEHNLPESSDTGSTGIYHLKRMWSRTLMGHDAGQTDEKEIQLDNALLNILGIGLLPAYTFLHGQKPDFEAFEKWVASHHGGKIAHDIIQQCNALFISETPKKNLYQEDFLSASDIDFWNKNGYVIIRNAISKEDCAESRAAVWNFLGMEENDPSTWYKNTEGLQGIMVQLYRHPALDKNRASPVIRRAYEQLWGTTNLIVTADKTGFNPPETANYKFRGTGLHWDVSLKQPVPFGVQGILYLTDTLANQGALTLIPGFHNKIENWLWELPAGRHPRNEDFSQFNPIPVTANAGDFIIWHHSLPHSSSPNRASSPRIVQYMYWYPPMQTLQQEWI